MGSHKRKADSTRKRSVKRQTKARRKPAAPKPSPTSPNLPDIGAELRKVVNRLERIEAYLMVATSSLAGEPSYSDYVRVLLRVAVGNLLFKQVRALEDLAARCDGGLPSERDHEDDPAEAEDMEGQP